MTDFRRFAHKHVRVDLKDGAGEVWGVLHDAGDDCLGVEEIMYHRENNGAVQFSVVSEPTGTITNIIPYHSVEQITLIPIINPDHNLKKKADLLKLVQVTK